MKRQFTKEIQMVSEHMKNYSTELLCKRNVHQYRSDFCSPHFDTEKAMAPHSNTLAWKIPQTEEPGRLQSMGSLRVGHNWALHFHFSLPCIGEGNGNPLQCSCLENPRDRGAWWAAVYGVAQSRTQLKWLSSSILTGLVFSTPKVGTQYSCPFKRAN